MLNDIENMTIAQAREAVPKARELLSMFGEDHKPQGSRELPFEAGTAVYVRTVTYHAVGRIVARRGQWLDLDEASYVGSDGRFSEATEKGVQNAKGSEIERVGNGGRMVINLDAVVDVTRHIEALPQATQ